MEKVNLLLQADVQDSTSFGVLAHVEVELRGLSMQELNNDAYEVEGFIRGSSGLRDKLLHLLNKKLSDAIEEALKKPPHPLPNISSGLRIGD